MNHRISIKQRDLPTLHSLGIATQYFPCYRNQQFNYHSVDVALISFIMQGRCRHYIDNMVFPSNGPAIGITLPDQTHIIITEDPGIEIMNIYLDLERFHFPDLPPSLSKYLPMVLPLSQKFVHKLNRIFYVDLEVGDPIIDLVKHLSRELENQHLGWEECTLSYFKLFLIEICRSIQKGKAAPLPREEHFPTSIHKIEQIRNEIDNHFREKISLKDLAKKYNLSVPYLCRTFKQYTGKTLIEYLLERRIQHAMILLQTTSYKLQTVLHESGFQDPSYFHRTFKKLIGLSPHEYRQKSSSLTP